MVRPGILLVGNHPPPYGGVPTHIEYLSRHLAPRWRVHVLSFARPNVPARATEGYRVHRPRLARWAGLPLPVGRVRSKASFASFRAAAPREYFTTLAIAKQIVRLVRRHRISILSVYHLLPSGLAAAWACEHLGLPLITTVFGEIYAAPDAHEARRAEIQYVLDSSRRMLSCSRHCAASLESWTHRTPPAVVYYGVDLERFSPRVEGSGIRDRLGIRPEQPMALFVGRLVREMGLETVLEAIRPVASTHPDVVFVIVGASGQMLAEARRVQHERPRTVRLLPDAPAGDLPAIYAAADVVLAPSINQRACLGLALLEAMASAKPVVGCAVGGTPEVVSDATGILVPPEHPRELAAATAGLISAPARRRAMGLAGRRAAEERFDFRSTCAQMESIFREALT
ncbi:MAG TPA: glycosyltransferase family 4 protein [Vicinamibacterales bacterium]|nr:glycosyltransferase family 4 protein [Vicinamibacterales bacterium]